MASCLPYPKIEPGENLGNEYVVCSIFGREEATVHDTYFHDAGHQAETTISVLLLESDDASPDPDRGRNAPQQLL